MAANDTLQLKYGLQRQILLNEGGPLGALHLLACLACLACRPVPATSDRTSAVGVLLFSRCCVGCARAHVRRRGDADLERRLEASRITRELVHEEQRLLANHLKTAALMQGKV